MIISGIYINHQANLGLKERFIDFTKKRNKQNITFFDNNFLTLIAGKTTPDIDQGQILKTSDALLIGKIFSKKDYKKITENDLKRISKKTQANFVDEYWGNYLLIKIDQEKQSLTILRDPVGQLPLFYTTMGNGTILFSSEISILYELTYPKPAVNWAYFSSYLVNSFITTNQTPFENCYELPHGCQVTFSQNTIRLM